MQKQVSSCYYSQETHITMKVGHHLMVKFWKKDIKSKWVEEANQYRYLNMTQKSSQIKTVQKIEKDTTH